MGTSRASIASLCATVAVFALGCAALPRSTPMWASVIFTATVVIFTLAFLRAINTDGVSRAFHIGLAICGWLYVMDTAFRNHDGSINNLHPALLTTVVLDRSLSHIIPDVFTRDQSGQINGVTVEYEIRMHSYYQIGHSLWALLSGLTGGWFAVFFRERHVKSA
jgi:hypothetical protein